MCVRYRDRGTVQFKLVTNIKYTETAFGPTALSKVPHMTHVTVAMHAVIPPRAVMH